jgi:hypothetical protein
MPEVIQTILRRSSAFLILLGAVLLIFGASNGINVSSFSFQISNLATQWTLIVIGIVMISCGLVGEVRSNPRAGSLGTDKDTPNQLSDMNLAGTWYVYYGFDTRRTRESAVGIAEISKPQGDRFKMTVHLNRSKLGRIIHNVFEYDGAIRNRQVLCTFKSASSLGGFMIGTMVMHPNPPGDKIFCGATYVNNYNKVVTDFCLLMKA